MSGYFSSVILLVYFCGVCYGAGANDPSALGYKYDAQISGWLKFNHNIADWVSARDSCRAEGAFLASDWTAEVASATSRLQNENSIWRLYSGVHLTQIISTEGGINGTTEICDAMTKPIKWVRTELCGVVYSNGSTGYVDCKLKLPSICYLSASEFQPQPNCGKNSSGYEYSPETRRCYKIHINTQTWVDANKICIEEGGLLTVPNSKAEVDVVTAMHNRYSDSEIHDSNWPNWSHVGIYWESGIWKTLDGTTLANSGYEKWGSGFPSHSDTLELCPHVCMHRHGDYSNMCSVQYHDKYPFVCEKNPHF